jgi:hypothetical protein
VSTLLPGLGLTLLAFGAGWWLLGRSSSGEGIAVERFGLRGALLLAALFPLHELLHGVLLRACGVPLADLRLRVRWWAILIDVRRAPGSRAMQLVAVAPALVLGLALAVLTWRTRSTTWLALFAIHAGSCAWDLRLAGNSRQDSRQESRQGSRQDSPRGAGRGVATLGLLCGIALLGAGLAPARWIRSTVLLTPQPGSSEAGRVVKSFAVEAGPARHLRATLSCWRDGVLALRSSGEASVGTSAAVLSVSLAYVDAQGQAEVEASLDGASLATLVVAAPPEVLRERYEITPSAARSVRLERAAPLCSVLAGPGAESALRRAGLDEGRLGGELAGAGGEPLELVIAAEVEFW